MTGWKYEDTLGKPLSTIFNITCEEKGKHIDDPVKKVLREGSFYGLVDNTVLITKEGMELPVDVIGSPIHDDSDNIIGVVLVFYDIIERKRIEAKLKN